ncbi:MAG: hypothetical protein GF330_11970 [Candidatus Eisenbacteria bacterium]|nr:hypothetical protein [Candidatus Eisenbacteria bacterium]
MIDERERRIYELCERDPRFRPQAFFLIYMALARARQLFAREGHIRGRELLTAFAEEARDQYGPMALTVLRHFGLRRTRDVGELVFRMVEEGLLSSTAEDCINDFDDVYDFAQAFPEQ